MFSTVTYRNIETDRNQNFFELVFIALKKLRWILQFTSNLSSFIFVSGDRLRQKLNRTNSRLVFLILHQYITALPHNRLIVYNKYVSTQYVINHFEWSFQSLPSVEKTKRVPLMISRATLFMIKKSALGVPVVNCFNNKMFKRRFVEDGGWIFAWVTECVKRRRRSDVRYKLRLIWVIIYLAVTHITQVRRF